MRAIHQGRIKKRNRVHTSTRIIRLINSSFNSSFKRRGATITVPLKAATDKEATDPTTTTTGTSVQAVPVPSLEALTEYYIGDALVAPLQSYTGATLATGAALRVTIAVPTFGRYTYWCLSSS